MLLLLSVCRLYKVESVWDVKYERKRVDRGYRWDILTVEEALDEVIASQLLDGEYDAKTR